MFLCPGQFQRPCCPYREVVGEVLGDGPTQPVPSWPLRKGTVATGSERSGLERCRPRPGVGIGKSHLDAVTGAVNSRVLRPDRDHGSDVPATAFRSDSRKGLKQVDFFDQCTSGRWGGQGVVVVVIGRGVERRPLGGPPFIAGVRVSSFPTLQYTFALLQLTFSEPKTHSHIRPHTGMHMFARCFRLARAHAPPEKCARQHATSKGDVSSMQVKPILGRRRGRAAAIGVLAAWHRGR